VTAPKVGRLPVTPVFDAVDEAGQPYFSPDRWRVMDGAERARLLSYLGEAPWALHAHDLEVDPLDPSRGEVVPIGYRTDGVWVWQEASEYYLESMGAAPDDEFVAHIQASGYAPPRDLPMDVLLAASDAAMAPSQPFPPESRRGLRYFANVTGRRSPTDPGGLLRTWRVTLPNGAEVSVYQTHRRDGRWRDTSSPLSPTYDSEHDLVEISARQAAAVIDRWWALHHS
jgi:hypothetical protein